MECKKCGREIEERFKYCPHCGQSLEKIYSLDAEKYRIMGKLKKAIEALEMIEDRDSFEERNLAELYYLKGDIEKAIYHSLKSLEKFPDSADTYYLLGIVYYRGGRISKSIEALKKCLELNDEFSMAHYWLGIAYYHAGNLEKAKESFLFIFILNC